jgi:hypothetical protein
MHRVVSDRALCVAFAQVFRDASVEAIQVFCTRLRSNDEKIQFDIERGNLAVRFSIEHRAYFGSLRSDSALGNCGGIRRY